MLTELIVDSVKQNASDLHLCAGHLPIVRINGELQTQGETTLSPERLTEQLLGLLLPEQLAVYEAQGQLDCAIELAGVRLRANIFQQRNGLSAALRFIQTSLPTAQQLDLPVALRDAANGDDGLILIAGATGSGKSTTLAATINEINQHQSRHIITLEDPIEFVHQSVRSLVQQREVGRHVDSFAQGLKAALRQDPDIILLGELRDAETIRLALTAAETGHLVFATLHTRSAIHSIERMVDVFPAEEKQFVATLLANSLRAVVCQQLLCRRQGGRVAAYEVLINTPAASNMIREGKGHQLQSVLQTGASFGMQTMEQHKNQLVAQGIIDRN